jgi:D-alanyl-D-alanine dipeptidase
LILFAACNRDIKEKTRLVHHRVFVIRDTTIADRPKLQISADTSYLEHVFNHYDLENLRHLDSSIQVRLRYADTSNFLKINFYDGLRNAYLPCEVALKLCNAQFFLKQIYPNYSLIIYDAARPLHIQQMMWDSLKMPADRKFNYLSPPYETSLHNYGCAVDLAIIDLSQNKLIDMGTDFDTFEKLSQPVYEWKFLKTGELSQQAYENRCLLRFMMKRAGFNTIPSEWWHFSYGNKEYAAAKFKLIK